MRPFFSMRVRQISVQKLFGIFDHRIPLKMEERITILHGLNGYGKTVVLQLLDGLLNGNYASLRTVPFDKFELDFDDDSILTIEKMHQDESSSSEGSKKSKARRFITKFTYLRKNASSETFELDEPKIADRNVDFSATSFTQLLEELKLVGHTPDIEASKKEFGGRQFEWPTYLLSRSSFSEKARSEPEWLRGIHKALQVHLIRTQRLSAYTDKSGHPQPLTVQQYSDEIAKRLRDALTQYAARSQELDRTFPHRLLQSTSPKTSTAAEVRSRFESLEKKRLRLADLGFIDPRDHQDLGQQQVEEAKLAVLGLYVSDVEEKLAVFDELAAKIELFRDIINARFQYKKVLIQRDKGLVFVTATGAELPPNALSSGEQHELVLLYEMLFKVAPNSLILIDEPEISLHIAWQNEFLKDLEKVVKLAGFDVLLATHSPDVIGERWDLTVKLTGPKDAARVA